MTIWIKDVKVAFIFVTPPPPPPPPPPVLNICICQRLYNHGNHVSKSLYCQPRLPFTETSEDKQEIITIDV